MHQLTRLADDREDDEGFIKIEEHMWLNGELKFGVRLVTSDKEFSPFKLMKRDYPSETADYILKNKVGRATTRKSKNIYVS